MLDQCWWNFSLKVIKEFAAPAVLVLRVEFVVSCFVGCLYESETGSPVIFKQGDDLRIDLGCLLVLT